MVASFTASNQIGEAMKKGNLKKKKVKPIKTIENKGDRENEDQVGNEPNKE